MIARLADWSEVSPATLSVRECASSNCAGSAGGFHSSPLKNGQGDIDSLGKTGPDEKALRACQGRTPTVVAGYYTQHINWGRLRRSPVPETKTRLDISSLKASLAGGFLRSQFTSTPHQRSASPPARGAMIAAKAFTAPSRNACCALHPPPSAGDRGRSVPRCPGLPCPASTWQSWPTSTRSSCPRSRRADGPRTAPWRSRPPGRHPLDGLRGRDNRGTRGSMR